MTVNAKTVWVELRSTKGTDCQLPKMYPNNVKADFLNQAYGQSIWNCAIIFFQYLLIDIVMVSEWKKSVPAHVV